MKKPQKSVIVILMYEKEHSYPEYYVAEHGGILQTSPDLRKAFAWGSTVSDIDIASHLIEYLKETYTDYHHIGMTWL